MMGSPDSSRRRRDHGLFHRISLSRRWPQSAFRAGGWSDACASRTHDSKSQQRQEKNALRYPRTPQISRCAITRRFWHQLKDLSPGKPLKVILHHAGGTDETIHCRHSFSAEQIAWFTAGAALNLLREE